MDDLFRAELQAATAYAMAARDYAEAGFPRLAAAALAGAREELSHAHRVAAQIAAMKPEPSGSPADISRAIEQAEADVLGSYMQAAQSGDETTKAFALSIIPEQVAALGEARDDRIRIALDPVGMETST